MSLGKREGKAFTWNAPGQVHDSRMAPGKRRRMDHSGECEPRVVARGGQGDCRRDTLPYAGRAAWDGPVLEILPDCKLCVGVAAAAARKKALKRRFAKNRL